jgi:hypothetical protein
MWQRWCAGQAPAPLRVTLADIGVGGKKFSTAIPTGRIRNAAIAAGAAAPSTPIILTATA